MIINPWGNLMPEKKLAILVNNNNSLGELVEKLSQVEKWRLNFEVLVVDHNCADQELSGRWLAQRKFCYDYNVEENQLTYASRNNWLIKMAINAGCKYGLIWEIRAKINQGLVRNAIKLMEQHKSIEMVELVGAKEKVKNKVGQINYESNGGNNKSGPVEIIKGECCVIRLIPGESGPFFNSWYYSGGEMADRCLRRKKGGGECWQVVGKIEKQERQTNNLDDYFEIRNRFLLVFLNFNGFVRWKMVVWVGAVTIRELLTKNNKNYREKWMGFWDGVRLNLRKDYVPQ